MCQAYEAEAAFIGRWEDRYALHGFLSALDGKPKESPRQAFGYEKKAWEHGFECFAERIFPWAAEKLIDYEARSGVRDCFKQTGKIHKNYINKFRSAGWIV